MTIATKIDGAWVALAGIQTLARTAPEAGEVQMDMGRVEALLAERIWTEADLAPFGLALAVPFAVPEGSRPVGPMRIVEIGGIPHEDFDLEEIEPPVPPTPEERLAAAGLTVDDLRQLLGLGAP